LREERKDMEKSLFKKGIVVIILLLFVGAGTFPTVMSEEKQNDAENLKNSNTKFSSRGPLQDMIDTAAPGSTIIVPCGTYYENIIIWKPLTLEGDNCVTIDGGGIGDVVNITADDVTISGFTIQNSGSDLYNSAIFIWGNNTIITYNNITNNHAGITNIGYVGWYTGLNLRISCNTFWSNTLWSIGLWYSDYTEITCNRITNSDTAIGFYDSENCLISCNNISHRIHNYRAIELHSCSNNEISSNSIWGHSGSGYGILIYYTTKGGNVVWGNTIQKMGVGIRMDESTNPNLLYYNNLIDNSVNAWDDNSMNNNWNIGCPEGGNYWDDRDDNDCYIPPDWDYCIYNMSGGLNAIDDCSLSAPYSCPNPPNAPTINGPTNGDEGTEYTYTFVSTDPNCDCLMYIVDWDDNSPRNKSELVPSGDTITFSHTWDQQGTYIIRAKAISMCGCESNWGTLTVTIPRNKAYNLNLLDLLIEQFPNALPILRQLLGL
jgi:hypothetical protein